MATFDGDRDGNPDFQNPGGTTTTNEPSKLLRSQYGIVYDLISEGEIEGLLGGEAGAYLNETPIANSGVVQGNSPRFGSVSTTASSTTIVADQTGLFNGVETQRLVQISGALKSDILSLAAEEGSTQIQIAGNFSFVHTIEYIRSLAGNSFTFEHLVIKGAGPDGDDYFGSILSVDGNIATISPKISTTVPNGTRIYLDFFSKIASITDGETLDLATGVPLTTANRGIQILPLTTSEVSDFNFRNSKVYFRNGTLHQPIVPFQEGQAPSATFIIQPNAELKQSDSTVTGATNPGGTQAVFSYSSSALGVSPAVRQEIDRITVVIEVPSGLAYFGEDGDIQRAVIDLQIGARFYYGLAADPSIDPSTDSRIQEIAFINRNPTIPFQRQRVGTLSPYVPGLNEGHIIERTQGSFFKEFTLDLKPYQPFTDFEILIARISPEEFNKYATTKGIAREENALLRANIKSVQASIVEKLIFPNSAYAVTTFSADDFATPPSRSYRIRGKKIKVPSNYITREELNYTNPRSQAAKYTRNISTGVDEDVYQSWDGSFRGDETLANTDPNFRKIYTDNPAWVFYDILTNKTYGLGDFLREEDIDIFSLYQIARYCDELVPDGKGGVEPRFTCNVYISSRQEAYKVLKDLSSCFRGMMYWIDGQIVGVQDRPKEPVYTFTQGNVIDGLFSYEYTGQRARINQVNVTWNDPTQLYRQSVVTVDDFDNIVEQNKVISKDVVAFGCTSEGQATRVGRWHLLTDTQETEIVKFQTSINAGFLRPGDWIKIQDSNGQDAKVNNVKFSGRVSKDSTSASINLDRLVEIQAGQSYNLYLIYPEPGCYLQQASAVINSVSYSRGDLILGDSSGNPITTDTQAANLVDDSGNSVFTSFSKNSRLEKKSVSSSAGETSVITVSSAFSSAPQQDVIWALSNINEQRVDAPVTYRILGISEDAVNLYSILAAKVITEKYDELEKRWAVYVDPYKPTASKDDEVPPPSNLKIEIVPVAGPDADSSGSSLRAIVSWNEPVESFTDSNGVEQLIKYRFIDSYEIQHTFFEGTRSAAISANRNSISFDNVNPSQEVTFRIRTRNTSGQRSRYVSVSRLVSPSQVPAPSFERLSKIVLGGQINSPILFNTINGLITIINSNYLFTSSIGKRYEVINATVNQREIDFSSLGDGSTAYWYFDFSDIADPWKTMIRHTDGVVENISGSTINFSYWKELGASNNGLTLASGTVSLSAGSDEVIGVSTSFTTDFAVGDLIKLSTNNTYTEEADAEYFEVASVESDTKLFVRINASKSFTDDYAYKQSFKPDFINDNILASVTNTAGTFSISYFVLKSGEDGLTIVPTNATHAFLQALDGTIDYTSYSCEFDVAQGDTVFTYDGSGTPAANTFSLAIDQQTNITASIDGNGVVTVSNMTDTTAEVAIEVTLNDTSAVFREILTFVLVDQAVRGSGTFTFEESTTSDITATDVQGWAEDIAFTNTHAQNVADAVIAVSSDGFIRPNDKITVTDNSADLAGTRIYTGSAQASSGSIQASNFSSLVVETFDGSVIVNGTLSAEKLLADSTFTQNLVVGSSFELNSSGKIYSTGKNTYADNDPGFFLGYDGGAYKFNLGNASNYLKWDGTDLEVAGNLTVGTVNNPTDLLSEINVEDGATAGATWGSNVEGQPADGGQNLIRDPRFDLSSAQGGLAQSSYWTQTAGGWSITGTDGRDGGPAALLGTSGGGGALVTKYRIPVVPGERFYGQITTNASVGFNGNDFRLEVRFLDKDGNQLGPYPDLIYLANGPAQGLNTYSGEIVLDPSETNLRFVEVWILCTTPTAGTLAVDDVYFGRASRGADTSGDTFTAQAGLLPNQNLSVRDSEQKPAGIYPVEGAVTDRSRISFKTYSGTFGLALDGTGTTAVAAFPAVAIDDRFDYKVRIRHASNGTSSDGYYLRFNELNTYPGSGKTHIGFNTTYPFTATRTSLVDLVSDGAVPGTSWVENEYDYTPTLGTKWASFSIYAWTGFSGVIYVDYVAIEPGTTAARGATNNGSTVNSSGNIVAPIELSGTGTIKAGKTAWNTGTGWLLEYNGGTPRFDIGNPSGNKLQWDGTNLTITGTINIQNPSDVRSTINVADGADVTSANTAAGISGQGALATQNSADFNTQVSGTEKPANNATNNGTTVNSSGDISGGMTMISGGGITLSSGGFIKSSGKDSLTDTTSGFFLGYDGSSSYDFSVGNGSKYIRWDGSAGTLSIGGDVVASGNIQANSITTPKILDNAVTLPDSVVGSDNSALNATFRELNTLTLSWPSGQAPASIIAIGVFTVTNGTSNNVVQYSGQFVVSQGSVNNYFGFQTIPRVGFAANFGQVIVVAEITDLTGTSVDIELQAKNDGSGLCNAGGYAIIGLGAKK